MGYKQLNIKAKDYSDIESAQFSQMPKKNQAELISHHFGYKRRRLSKPVVDAYLKSIKAEGIYDVSAFCIDEEARRKFFRALKNLHKEVLNTYLDQYCKRKELFEAIKLFKLEDRKKIAPDFLLNFTPSQLATLINEHFDTFGKLNPALFPGIGTSFSYDECIELIKAISCNNRAAFIKAAFKNSLNRYVKVFGLNRFQLLLDGIKGDVGMIVSGDPELLVRSDKVNKKNVLLINAFLFDCPVFLHAEMEIQLYFIKLRQRKHIDSIIEPLFHDLKLLHLLFSIPSRELKRVVSFIKKNKINDRSYVYRILCSDELQVLTRISANQYNKKMQKIFDMFYDDFIQHYDPKNAQDGTVKKNIKKLIASRFIEYQLENGEQGEIPFLFKFDSRLDDDGRVLLGYSRLNGTNMEIRPTIKNFAGSFVRFRPRLSMLYDVFKINAKGKILDFVPVNYSLTDSRFQHISPGVFVAAYVKNEIEKPISFRTYLTADSKLYFGKIDNEVIQTLISYLDGNTPIECTVLREENGYLLNVFILNAQTGKYEYSDPIRSIMLNRERPYFTDIRFDFTPEMFLSIEKSAFNNILQYFKTDYFLSFYNGLKIEQKKQIFEKLTQKAEGTFIEKIGEELFNDDLEKLSSAFGDDLDVIDDFMSDKMSVGQEYVEISGGRRKSDHAVVEVNDLDDNAFFAQRESERLEEFGFDFTSYPPELTFKIKNHVLMKIYESFPGDLRRYIKIHSSEIDDEIQEKIVEIDPRLLDGVELEKDFAVRRDPIKRAFINDVIQLLEDRVSYDLINDIIHVLRDSSYRILKHREHARFMVKPRVIGTICQLSGLSEQELLSHIAIDIIE